MATFDETALARRLEGLPHLARVAFATACAARMRIPYRQALGQFSVDRPDVLDDALSHLWAYSLSGAQVDWTAWSESLIEQIPPEDDMANSACQVMDDALAAAAYAARTARGGDPAEAAYSARRLYDAVDAYAQRSLAFTEFTPEIERALSDHPVVQQELGRQARDLAELEYGDTASAILTLSNRARIEAAF